MSETVYREGNRIRSTDGTGYSDRVSDDQIREHMRLPDNGPRFTAFSEAVLAIRAYERVSVHSDNKEQPK